MKNEGGRNTAGEHALITITDSTGGGFFTLDSLDQLDSMFDRIDRELRTQYLLAYYPSQRTSNSQFRRIQVGVTGPANAASYRVRHRVGYYTMKSDF